MGDAARRPANSGIGAYLRNCSNIFYQKLLTNPSVGGGKEKGLKGKGNCRRLPIALARRSLSLAPRYRIVSLRPRFARPSLWLEKFSLFYFLLF
jgi:hypothetical protein